MTWIRRIGGWIQTTWTIVFYAVLAGGCLATVRILLGSEEIQNSPLMIAIVTVSGGVMAASLISIAGGLANPYDREDWTMDSTGDDLEDHYPFTSQDREDDDFF